ncbi:MAG: hypothetical protein V9F03_14295 [Microthrixaceae bacterium]
MPATSAKKATLMTLPTRIVIWCAVAGELFKMSADTTHTSLFFQLSDCGITQILRGQYESAGKSPRIPERWDAPLDQQHIERTGTDRKHDKVDCYRRIGDQFLCAWTTANGGTVL